MKVLRLTEPTVEPLTLAEAKEHLRVNTNAEDDYITALISAARAKVEDYCQRAFVSADFAILYDGDLPTQDAVLSAPLAGITAISEVTYTDAAGAVQTWGASSFIFDAERQTIKPTGAWPDGSDLRVEVTAGDDSSPLYVPPAIKMGIKMFLAGLYELRQDYLVGETLTENPAAMGLIQPYRLRMGM